MSDQHDHQSQHDDEGCTTYFGHSKGNNSHQFFFVCLFQSSLAIMSPEMKTGLVGKWIPPM